METEPVELGTDDATNASLLKQLNKAVAKLLSGSGSVSAELSAVFFAAATGKAAVSSRQTMSSSGKMRYFFISFSIEL